MYQYLFLLYVDGIKFKGELIIRLITDESESLEEISLSIEADNKAKSIFRIHHRSNYPIKVRHINVEALGDGAEYKIFVQGIDFIDLNLRSLQYFVLNRWLNIGLGGFSSAHLRNLAGKPGVFEIFKGRDNQYYFRLRAANHEIIAQSEGYTRKSSAKKGINSIRSSVTRAKVKDLT